LNVLTKEEKLVKKKQVYKNSSKTSFEEEEEVGKEIDEIPYLREKLKTQFPKWVEDVEILVKTNLIRTATVSSILIELVLMDGSKIVLSKNNASFIPAETP
jgi:hypothetical protein